MFQLNKKARIKVRTPVGISDSCETNPLVSQGSSEGAIMSAVNLDNGISDYFHDKEERKESNEEEDKEERKEIKDTEINKVKYDSVEINPMLFQDDIANVSESIEDAQIANNKIEDLLETKLLSLNVDKSSFLIIGSKKAKTCMKEKLKETPLTLGKTIMREAKEEKYLGIWVAGSVVESATATVNHRLGLASKAIQEIRVVIEDSRADSLGAVETGIMLFEQSVLPMLLFGLEVFHLIPKKTMKQLNDLCNRFHPWCRKEWLPFANAVLRNWFLDN